MGSYDNLYGGVDDYYGYRCPEYKPATVSKWRETHDGRFAVKVGLPGVHADNQRVWLGEDGSTLHVRAARSVRDLGGRRCLPRTARLSEDGRAEILELGMSLPSAGEASRTTIRNVQGGVEILVPRLRHAKPHGAAQNDVRDSIESPSTFQATYRTAQNSPSPRPSRRQSSIARRQIQWWKLPPSDGIEVVDEDWPADEKRQDAAEGWVDNRGEFQHY